MANQAKVDVRSRMHTSLLGCSVSKHVGSRRGQGFTTDIVRGNQKSTWKKKRHRIRRLVIDYSSVRGANWDDRLDPKFQQITT